MSVKVINIRKLKISIAKNCYITLKRNSCDLEIWKATNKSKD